ncbi:MAG: glucose-6-phosphate isomerase [Candidatus Latescibacterota bacterium]|nr:glucose-6-phosphate isomerase [Candidatus Latescibacterota bacterium]
MTVRIVSESLSPLEPALSSTLQALSTQRICQRILGRDHTVWSPDPTEISNRLGWLDSPKNTRMQLAEIESVATAAREAGLREALLLGMGGSSLAPEVFRRCFGIAEDGINLAILDSTDPAVVLKASRTRDPRHTLFIPATKSGGTIETLSLLKFFHRQVSEAVGEERAGSHFVAITDPGSGLQDMARNLGFRHTFLNDPDIGGRYSALSLFGMVPARFGGVDLNALLINGANVIDGFSDGSDAARLGAAMGVAAREGRDKVTLVLCDGIAPLGAWIEQLVAESTGKEGRGILPVEGEALTAAEAYNSDRLFVQMGLAGSPDSEDPTLDRLRDAGHPVLRVELSDLHDIAGAMVLWELATVIAGQILSINPFDQPNVESAKVLARSMMATYQERGALPEPEPVVTDGAVSIYGESTANSVEAALKEFFSTDVLRAPGYLGLQAYTPVEPVVESRLQRIRHFVRDRRRVATTLGYGPRFLHSTGQLHKGDEGHGRFLQLTWDPPEDAAIPELPGDASSDSVSFGVLITAQALGDRQALHDAGRAVMRVHLGSDVEAGLEQIESSIESALG